MRLSNRRDHNVTSRSGWSPRPASPRSQAVTINRLTAPEPENTTPAKSPTWPDYLACPKRRPAMEDM